MLEGGSVEGLRNMARVKQEPDMIEEPPKRQGARYDACGKLSVVEEYAALGSKGKPVYEILPLLVPCQQRDGVVSV